MVEVGGRERRKYAKRLIESRLHNKGETIVNNGKKLYLDYLT